jgi:protein required for attachment to host cells
MLDEAYERKDFDQLVLVAPHRSLGELRGLLSERVQRCVRKEIARDLTGVTPSTLWRHLQPEL